MSKPKTLQGMAESALGHVDRFSTLLDFNPEQIPFEFPPQIEMGLGAARQIAELTGADIKVPTTDELKKLATGELSKVLGPLGEVQEVLGKARQVLPGIQGALETFKGLGSISSAEDIPDLLQSIEWLL